MTPLVKRVAILQSNYIPWKGYFDLLGFADEFILFDDMQYTRRDWRNRNRIKTPTGLQWLTVPVQSSGKYHQSIRDTLIDGHQWADEHWKSIQRNYRKAPYFDDVCSWLAPHFETSYKYLIDLNHSLIHQLKTTLNLRTHVSVSWDYQITEGKSERLLSLCQQAGATHYVSGPSAQAYLDTSLFANAGITIEWFSYNDYPVYPQLWGQFEHGVSILDLLFNTGPAASFYIQKTTKPKNGSNRM